MSATTAAGPDSSLLTEELVVYDGSPLAAYFQEQDASEIALPDDTQPSTYEPGNISARDWEGERMVVSSRALGVLGTMIFGFAWCFYARRWKAVRHLVWPMTIGIVGLGIGGLWDAWHRQRITSFHNRILDHLESFLSRLTNINTASRKAIRFIQEVELVARGYNVSQTLPPITRIEQATTAKRLLQLRQALHVSLSAASTALQELHSHVKGNPAVGSSIPGYVAPNDVLSLSLIKGQAEELEETVVEVLAALLLGCPTEDGMTEQWSAIDDEMVKVGRVIADEYPLVIQTMEREEGLISSAPPTADAKAASNPPPPSTTAPFLTHATILSQTLHQMKLKLLVCIQDLQLTTDPPTQQTIDVFTSRLSTLDNDLERLRSGLAETRDAVAMMLDPVTVDVKIGGQGLQSSEQIAAEEGEELAVHDAVEVVGLCDGDAGVWEASGGVGEREGGKAKTSRESRLKAQKTKRAVDAKVKADREVQATLMSELKTVLEGRAAVAGPAPAVSKDGT
ncbi:uncharacterized protein EV422DRAFT_147712 [Fimicolochytrium jonesii]|uniref:uncharacterized protein n=1 Tax=Fimicolochytrium jonesii TaxID=1396493 RepID=UPI0022FE0C04|nr:uncharacterized protein EV422DRAFT_147712 [Fimicolochytrium jonesii]KAI8825961.1 hypothetical protein EV422DRAFT_147712 [Fimicolochytrium jonesii]